ncbi:hypothetical protein F5141DRAFT_1100038 [Pisolithus sp. B1]|nr:hypothetical protein F5141DRAFT_1100038 [Pisolithus sp. B1]
MKRNQSTGRLSSSPTQTTSSGISNYRTDSCGQIRHQASVSAVPQPDPKTIASIHRVESSQYPAAYFAKSQFHLARRDLLLSGDSLCSSAGPAIYFFSEFDATDETTISGDCQQMLYNGFIQR